MYIVSCYSMGNIIMAIKSSADRVLFTVSGKISTIDNSPDTTTCAINLLFGIAIIKS